VQSCRNPSCVRAAPSCRHSGERRSPEPRLRRPGFRPGSKSGAGPRRNDDSGRASPSLPDVSPHAAVRQYDVSAGDRELGCIRGAR